MKLLIYTDSRGQHTPRGAEPHPVFAERLAARNDVEASVVLCPMKWTTTVDFLDFLEEYPAEDYDHVILFTGIVDWSPRPQKSAIGQLYHNEETSNLDAIGENTRDYTRKVVNDKKHSFDALFGESAVKKHLATDFGVDFEGQPTVNMYSLDMAREKLLPRLKAIPNLLFVNSNRFIKGWEGDYARGRPSNIKLTEQYSALFREVLGDEKVIDLLQWSDANVKTYTCDNLHLTKEGSDWIYDRICRRLRLPNEIETERDAAGTASSSVAPIAPFGRPISAPPSLSAEGRDFLRGQLGLSADGPIATLVIGLRIGKIDGIRTRNFLFLLEWIERSYGNLFEILVVEQDVTSRLGELRDRLPRSIRHEFIYNDRAYNRGWGYNVALRHFVAAEVAALMDTDVLPGANFLDEILSCLRGEYDVVSPYTNVYFTNPMEAEAIRESAKFDTLQDETRITKPTTLTGGVVIVRREVFEQIAGFEQYTGYGGEDRALDVTVNNHIDLSRVRMAPFTYVHLHHPSGEIDEDHLSELLGHLDQTYGCSVDRALDAEDFIHVHCDHVDAAHTARLIEARRDSYGELDLYRASVPLTINGCYLEKPKQLSDRLIFPPAFKGLSYYPEREHYRAPAPDSDRLAGLYNAFKGKRCFIIGNGPTLNNHDLSWLENEYTFGVNSFFYKTRETGFRPTFYVVEDNAVMKENIEEIRQFDAPMKFFPTIYKPLHPEADNVFFFEMNRGFYEKSSPNYCVPRFSTDSSKLLYCGQSVTYINLQLAFFMGFTEVYLIGMDFDYVIPDAHQRRGDLIVSTTDDPNHFHKDYFGVGKTWKDPKLDRVAMNYQQAKLSFEAVGRTIHNATIGGKLEIFPRADYASLFDPKPANPVPIEDTLERVLEAMLSIELREARIDRSDLGGRSPAQRRAARWAKFRRDPHQFFRDSRNPALRSLRHLFAPTKIGKTQAELTNVSRDGGKNRGKV